MEDEIGMRIPGNAASAAAAWVRRASQQQDGWQPPRVGVILGSGLGGLLADMAVAQRFVYDDIPYFAPPTVEGHAGHFELGMLAGVHLAVLRGRHHLYEGYSPQRLALPVRTLHALGVTTLIITNAAGGLNPAFAPGDLMLVRDHIGLPTLAGLHPLLGPNDEALGPRFTPMATAYDPALLTLARQSAATAHVPLHEGVYIMVAGPTYETPAEMRALRTLGADAVGMSTVPEVIAARHVGMRVVGISCITNCATPETAATVNHTEVLTGAQRALPRLNALLHALLANLAPQSDDQAADVRAAEAWPAITARQTQDAAPFSARRSPAPDSR
jgi:purine-nucleoside phosphorylase